MEHLQWPRLAGQERIKDVIASAYKNNTLGHAYLFCGEPGCGSFAAALDFAGILLCQSGTSKPCGVCGGCQKIKGFNHPDLHIVIPLCLLKEHKGSDGRLTDAGWEMVTSNIRERIDDPYTIPDYTGNPSIPLELMRETNQAIHRGAMADGYNVVIIDGIDSLNKESANSMLKVLEEPPAGTVMLLLTDRLLSVLPTIVSRCQIMRFAALPPEVIKSELVTRYSLSATDSRINDVAYTGTLGGALHLWRHPPATALKEVAVLWDYCVAADWEKLGECIDALSLLNDFGVYESLFTEIIHRARNAFLKEMTGTATYFLGEQSRSVELAMVRSPANIEAVVRLCQNAISAVRSHSNCTLVLSNFVIALIEELHGKQQ